jgi:hypothetical protein
MKLSFKANILVEYDDKREPPSISYVCLMLDQGLFKVELPQFINEPTIILKEKDAKNGA